MKQALEALEINLVFLRNVKPFKGQEDLASDCVAMTEETITSLRQAIAEAEKQEPVGYFKREGDVWVQYYEDYPVPSELTAFYTHSQPAQPKREWVGLTPADFDKLEQLFGNKVSNDFVFANIVCVISAKLKEKNT